MARELIDREKTIYEVKQLFCKLIDANIFQMDVVDMAAAVAKKISRIPSEMEIHDEEDK